MIYLIYCKKLVNVSPPSTTIKKFFKKKRKRENGKVSESANLVHMKI
jgi:hypothetical protein